MGTNRQDCRDAGGRAMPGAIAEDPPDTYVASGRLRVAHPCAQSRSTVHPEHNGPVSKYPPQLQPLRPWNQLPSEYLVLRTALSQPRECGVSP